MITAVDTNVLIDVFSADREHGPGSREAVRRCIAEGGLVACEVVWAEVAAGFRSPSEAATEMDALGVGFAPLERSAALAAGEAFGIYRRRGCGRERVVADFLVGAHASLDADRLLARDRGFFRSCFPGLSVLDPSSMR